MDGAGLKRKGQLPPALASLSAPQEKNLIMIKCFLATIHMSRCDLLNVIVCTITHIGLSMIFESPNIKKQANLWLLLNVQKLKVFQRQGELFLPP